MPDVYQLSPEEWCLEDHPFLLGPANFGGVELLNFQGAITQLPFWLVTTFEKSCSSCNDKYPIT